MFFLCFFISYILGGLFWRFGGNVTGGIVFFWPTWYICNGTARRHHDSRTGTCINIGTRMQFGVICGYCNWNFVFEFSSAKRVELLSRIFWGLPVAKLVEVFSQGVWVRQADIVGCSSLNCIWKYNCMWRQIDNMKKGTSVLWSGFL